MRPGGWSAIVSTGPRSFGPRPGRVGDFGPDEPRGSDACFSVVPLKDPHRAGCADDFGHSVQSTLETDIPVEPSRRVGVSRWGTGL